MKNLATYSFIIAFISTSFTFNAQEIASILDEVPANYKNHNTIYDVTGRQISSSDTIPEFNTKTNKLKISGTIFQCDGKTPAKNVLLLIYQPDEYGEYDVKKDDNRKRYIYHRAWIKTDNDGNYTFYTFVPGKYLRSKELKQIHRVIKEPGKTEQELNSFIFNNDPQLAYLNVECRNKASKDILKLEKEGDMFVATNNITLGI